MAKTYELRIETSEFKKALDVLSTVINKKNALPILADALLKYDRERKAFAMTAYNGEQWLTLPCYAVNPTEDEDEPDEILPWLFLDKDDRSAPFDAVCLNVAYFREAFGTLPTLPVTCYLSLADEGGSMRVCYGKGEFTLPVESALEYPTMISVVEKGGEQREGVSPLVKFAIETDRLLPAIVAARVCSGNSELRPVMNTVCVDCFHDHAVVVATDGHSLYRQMIDTGMGWLRYGEFGATESAKLLVPTSSMAALTKAFLQSESITVTADSQRICFDNGRGLVLTAQTPDGSYPNYESVIPKETPHRLTLDRQELAATLRRVSLFAEEGSNMCILCREGDGLVVTAADTAMGRNANEQVGIINTDTSLPQGFRIGFRIAVLQQLLGCIASENVTLDLLESNRPMLMKEDKQASSLTLLLMPMLINE